MGINTGPTDTVVLGGGMAVLAPGDVSIAGGSVVTVATDVAAPAMDCLCCGGSAGDTVSVTVACCPGAPVVALPRTLFLTAPPHLRGTPGGPGDNAAPVTFPYVYNDVTGQWEIPQINPYPVAGPPCTLLLIGYWWTADDGSIWQVNGFWHPSTCFPASSLTLYDAPVGDCHILLIQLRTGYCGYSDPRVTCGPLRMESDLADGFCFAGEPPVPTLRTWVFTP